MFGKNNNKTNTQDFQCRIITAGEPETPLTTSLLIFVLTGHEFGFFPHFLLGRSMHGPAQTLDYYSARYFYPYLFLFLHFCKSCAVQSSKFKPFSKLGQHFFNFNLITPSASNCRSNFSFGMS